MFLPAITMNIAEAASLTGRGNEPGWHVEISDKAISFRAMGGESFTIAPVPQPARQGDTDTYSATVDGREFALTVADVSVTETDAGTTVAPMVIAISPTRNAPTTVKYATSNGTATQPADYAETSGTATIPANTASVTVNVLVKGDTLYEDNETFNFTLSEPSSGVEIGDGDAVVTIQDNDAPPADPDKPVLTVKNASLKEGAGGTTSTLNFEVTLSAASTHTVTVKASTSDGTAKAPGDYIAKTDFTITFTPGQTTQNFPVTLVGDNVYEGDEDFTVTLSAPSAGAKLAATPTAKGTILEDEDRPTLTVADAQANEGGVVEFTITLSAPIDHDVLLRYGTGDLTAKEPGDYTKVLESTGVTLPAGQTTKKVSVTTKQDTLDEYDELFAFVVQMIDGNFVTNPPVTANGKIVDDDASPTISVDNVTKNEGNEGTTPFEFTVTLSAASGRAVSINYATTGITATTPEDFTGTNGTLNFAPGIRSAATRPSLLAGIAGSCLPNSSRAGARIAAAEDRRSCRGSAKLRHTARLSISRSGVDCSSAARSSMARTAGVRLRR